MSNSAVLIGFARPVPGIAGFVIPIWLDSEGRVCAQIEQNSIIIGFAPVTVGDDFEPINFSMLFVKAVREGNVSELEEITKAVRRSIFTTALYAFEEFVGDRVILGSRPDLASYLEQILPERLGPHAKAPVPYAAAARFIGQEVLDHLCQIQREKHGRAPPLRVSIHGVWMRDLGRNGFRKCDPPSFIQTVAVRGKGRATRSGVRQQGQEEKTE